ncbi:hypothetical protein [Paenibacillus endoradicis]|uniref:hypothetical protein n=1 Tax=Paenibacillus endoradicis TaxID=2972487 RepID=UPI0021593CA4|nr:hypothetical protein [Paenibacillus endoradicis]MCR8659372.1 hypothetical protein [Paenibacillus endoradicis]
MKRKEQHKNLDSVRINSKGKNSSTGKGKRKATEQSVVKKSTKSPKTSEKSIKANSTSTVTTPLRHSQSNHQHNEIEASSVSLTEQHKGKRLEQSKERSKVEEATTSLPSLSEHDHQVERKINDHKKYQSERDNLRSIDNKAAKFLEKCEKSKFLKVSKRNSSANEIFPIQLPEGLPSRLLMKALQKEQQTLTVLREQVIQLDQVDEGSIDVHLETINSEQLSTLVKELDELIGQFTARN